MYFSNNMKRTLNLILNFAFLLLTLTTLGQEFDFEIQGKTLSDYIALEEKLGSQLTPTTSNHISGKGIAQPIKYQRKENFIPDLISYYFFQEQDSTMTYILHEWDVRNFDKSSNNKQSEKFQIALQEKYNALKSQISEIYGASQTELKSNQTTDIWQLNNGVEIEMYIVISNNYKKKGIITINPTHRIRLYIKNKTLE